MPRQLNAEKICQLQKNTKNIRNICIMAHVDHGKTTLADSLVASNGIISQKLVGKLRYLDSRKDEQERGITMKSSCISLLHMLREQEFLINLIDSPGHVDFCSEVSTAVRLCDGAIVLVDVVEGVCAQTKVVLKQAWLEHIRPVLVLNKIDRLIVEMKMQPLDAYIRMMQLVEQVNAQLAEFFTMEVMSKRGNDIASSSAGLEDADDSNLYFSPEQGNVAFASASDGWGFLIEDFSRMFHHKLGLGEEILRSSLWGDYYFNSKFKTVVLGAQEKAKKPLFVQIVLENIWSVYESVVIRQDKIMTEKIVKSLQLNVMPRDLKHSDPKVQIQAILSKWLPLSDAVLKMVCEKLPSPVEMSQSRAERLMSSLSKPFDTLPPSTQEMKKAFVACSSSEDAPVIVFVSKMILVDHHSLPKNKVRPLTNEDIAKRRELVRQKIAELSLQKENQAIAVEGSRTPVSEDVTENPVFIAFARVFSGTLTQGKECYVLGPKYDPRMKIDGSIDPCLTLKDLKANQHVTRVNVGDLYLMMGRELETLENAPAGCIVGIGGLEEHILKSGTLSTTLSCPAFTELSQMVIPIVRVAVEPARPNEMQELVRGLKLLNQADPCVQVVLQESGEHVLITAGEVHLQRCLQDLKENYAKIDIIASQPIVPFRETILSSVEVTNKDNLGSVQIVTPDGRFSLQLRAVSLPGEVVSLLEKYADLIKIMRQSRSIGETQESSSESFHPDTSQNQKMESAFVDLRNQLDEAFRAAKWNDAVDKILSFGPRHCGPNLLLDKSSTKVSNVWIRNSKDRAERTLLECLNSVINGFQLATLAGPLCEEPLFGVAFIIENLTLTVDSTLFPSPLVETKNDDIDFHLQSGPLSGQIISTVKDGCRRAFQNQPQRLMVAMYNCSIQVSGEVVGKMYGVLSRRHGKILDGDLEEGSTSFSVTAVLPVVESFDLANEIRKQTSGLASHQLTFSHWEVLDVDPFWVPSTEEELELYGDKGDSVNRAQNYMNSVRRRKGLAISEKVVEFAEKQRTLSRKV